MITKTCLGFSTTVVVASAIAEWAIVSHLVVSLRTALLFNLFAGASGLIVFFLAWIPKNRRRRTDPEYQKQEIFNLDYHPLGFFHEATYWGAITFIVMGITSVIPVYGLIKPKVNVVARSIAPPPVPVKFPPMELQGIVLRGLRSSAMIDGKIYFLGDHIGAVRVVAIDKESVTLELSGQTNMLHLSP